jgi:hypothetical protein
MGKEHDELWRMPFEHVKRQKARLHKFFLDMPDGFIETYLLTIQAAGTAKPSFVLDMLMNEENVDEALMVGAAEDLC